MANIGNAAKNASTRSGLDMQMHFQSCVGRQVVNEPVARLIRREGKPGKHKRG